MPGQTFRYIRKNKGQTLKAVAEGITTASSISQFENGHIKLNFETLLILLDRLNTTVEEYKFLLNEKSDIPNQNDFHHQLKQAYQERNVTLINHLFQLENLYLVTDNNVRHEHNIILLTQLKNVIEHQESDSSLTDPIKDYLFSCEDWGFYELNLFNNYIPYFPRSYLVELIEFIRKKASIYEGLHPQRKLKALVTLNILSQLIGSEYPKLVNQLFRMVEQDLAGTTDLYERNYYQFLYGKNQMSLGMIELGQKACNDAIQILEHFGLYKQAKLYQHELERYIERYTNDNDSLNNDLS